MTRPDDGPFFHGTVAALRPGDLLTAGRPSNNRPEVVMNNVHFTALRNGAGLAAELAVEPTGGGAEPRVHEVDPTGPYEDDPTVTDTRFPGDLTRSFRSRDLLRVVAEVHGTTRLSPEALRTWRERLAALSASRAEIVN